MMAIIDRNILMRFLVLAFCLMVSACSKDSTTVSHAPAIATEKFSVAVNTDDGDVPPEPVSIADKEIFQFNTVNGVYKIHTILANADKNKERVDLVFLKSVADIILKPVFIGSHLSGNDFVYRTFYFFNRQFLLQVKNEMQTGLSEVSKSILGSYREAFFMGCSSGLKKCKNVDFFSKIQNSRDILITDIEVFHGPTCIDIDKNDYFNKVRYANALHYNVETDSLKLEAFYLQCVVDRLKYLGGQISAKEKKGVRVRELEEEIENLKLDTTDILRRLQTLQKVPALKSILKNFEEKLLPKMYHADYLPSGNFAQIALFRLQEIYLKQNPSWISDQDFVKEVHEDNLKKSDDFVYDKILALFEAEKSSILKNFFIKPLEHRDAFFTIVESIATKRWSPALGVDYYNQLKFSGGEQDKKKHIEKILQNYAQIMFFRQIVNTNAKMGEFYKNNKEMTQDLIDVAITTSQSYSSDWSIFYDRIAMLRQFASAVLQVPVSKLAHIGLDANSLLLSSYYMISFPHMLMLAFVAAKKKFEMTVYTFFGVFKFNHVDILEWILEGGIKPWFVYAPGKTVNEADARFNGYQVLQSIYYAFRTETFRVFGVNEEEFLKVILEAFTQRHTALYQDSFSVQSEALQEMNEEYRKLQRVCLQENIWWKARINNISDFVPSYDVKLDFDQLREGILSKTPWFKSLVGKAGKEKNITRNGLVSWDHKGLHLTRTGMQERLDHMILSTNRVVRYIESIIEIYKQYRLDQGEARIDVFKKIDSFSHDFERLKHERRKFYTLINKLSNEYIKGCVLNLAFHENILFNKLRLEEIEHLKRVYQDRRDIHAGKNTYDEKISKYRFSGYEQDGYIGRDGFDGEYYTYTNLDAQMRLIQQLKKVSPNISVTMPKQGELHWREAYRKTEWYEEVPFFSGSGGEFVSQERFIQDALAFGGRAGERSARAFFNWEIVFALYDVLGDINKTLLPYYVQLDKLGEVELYSEQNTECLGSNVPSPNVCPVVRKRLIDQDFMLEENWKLAELVSVKPEEEEIYRLNSISSKFNMNFMMYTMTGTGKHIFDWSTEGTLFDPQTGKNTAFFDYLFNLSIAPMAGLALKLPWSLKDDGDHHSYYDPARKSLQDQLLEYYDSQKKLEFMPFKVDKKTADFVHRIYRNAFQKDYVRVSSIEKKILQWEENDKKNGIVRRLRRNLDVNPHFGPYLSTHYLADYQKLMKDFHRDTNGFFLLKTMATTDE